ncbi:MAG TPA: DMT family transporter [Steroidobacteraceae bacterium]
MLTRKPAQAPRTRLSGVLFAAIGATAFSGKAIIAKLAYRYGVDAVTVLMYRMLFALPMFLVLAWWSGRDKPSLTARDWRVLALLGFTGYYLASFLDFEGLQYISANLERLIIYLTPTFVLALNVLVFKARVKRMQVIALVVSYVGVLVVFGRDITLEGSNIALGAALVLGSALAYATYLAFSGEAVKRFGALRITGVATSIACVLCIAQFFVLRPASAIIVPSEVIWLSVLNATACTFLPVLLVMMAVERVGSTVSAQVGAVGPMTTIIFSAALLGEPITLSLAVGTTLVLAGVWLLTRSR